MADPTATCLLSTSDAADEEDSVDLGGRRIITTTRSVINIIKRATFRLSTVADAEIKQMIFYLHIQVSHSHCFCQKYFNLAKVLEMISE